MRHRRSGTPAPGSRLGRRLRTKLALGALAWVSAWGLALPLACGAQTQVAMNPPAGAAASGYVLGPGDVVAVDVWKEAEISRTLPISPTGALTLPLAGQVQAAGLTTVALQQVLTARLKKYIDDPAVTVMLQEAVSRRYNILGQVSKPGSYVLTHPTSILDAIAAAGGLTAFAQRTHIYLLRAAAGASAEQRFAFNYKAVSRGRSLPENIPLQPGDTIIVP
ncbi:MAG: polysaccharide biosynthesis/export family protein [Terriglobales bacterium]